MGSRTFTDGVWAWPEGLVHYVDVHDVRPPDDFVAWIQERGEAAAGQPGCPYVRERGVGPLPTGLRRVPHFRNHRVALHPEEKALRLAELLAARRAKRQWLDAAPAGLRRFCLTGDWAGPGAHDALLAAHGGQPQSALAALLTWYAEGTGAWDERLGGPLVAELIQGFPKHQVAELLDTPLATTAVFEGAARYIVYWGYGRRAGAAREWVPHRLRARLRAAATSTGHEKNVVLLEAVLGTAEP